MKQNHPSAAAMRAILLEAVEEITHLRKRLDESTDVLGVYHAATLPFEHLMKKDEESRAVWMRDSLGDWYDPSEDTLT